MDMERMGRGSPLPETHNYIKDVVTKALEHYVKPSLVNTVCLQMVAYIYVLHSALYWNKSCRWQMLELLWRREELNFRLKDTSACQWPVDLCLVYMLAIKRNKISFLLLIYPPCLPASDLRL